MNHTKEERKGMIQNNQNILSYYQYVMVQKDKNMFSPS